MVSKEFHPLAVQVGLNIASMRKRRRMTQSCLAGLLGVSLYTVLRIEKGKVEPDFAKLQAMSELFGCRVRDFFLEKPDERPDEMALQVAQYMRLLPENGKRIALRMLEVLVDGDLGPSGRSDPVRE